MKKKKKKRVKLTSNRMRAYTGFISFLRIAISPCPRISHSMSAGLCYSFVQLSQLLGGVHYLKYTRPIR
jgi:hypothetical protein